MISKKSRRGLFLGLAFFSPNLIGFLIFTLFPLIFSLVLAFSNWDIRLHNMFREETISFVGLDNFIRLLTEEKDFPRYLGNTLFLMLGIPFSITGSLLAAILLSRDLSSRSRRVHWQFVCGVILFCSTVMLAVVGMQATAMTILICGVACGMLITGSIGGTTVYRTLFYLPHFTSGVAIYILWKKLYNPYVGPVNSLLSPPLAKVADIVNGFPVIVHLATWFCLVLMAVFIITAMMKLIRMWHEREVRVTAIIIPFLLLIIPIVFAFNYYPRKTAVIIMILVILAVVSFHLVRLLRQKAEYNATVQKGFGNAFMLCLFFMTGAFAALGMGIVFFHLPTWAVDGLKPPGWLADYHWAKPAIMIMGFWAAVGSNNMLLYLAGLSNVPTELLEAADIDGASRFQRFWHIIWPQLAPITFFIVVMSVINGLKGGFEMARTMTKGGPAGATTTLSYFIYREGFEAGRFGYASAVAWALFALVFMVTLFNWKFGSRYVND